MSHPTLYKIAQEFMSINFDDLSTLEQNVAQILIDEGYLVLDSNNELQLT